MSSEFDLIARIRARAGADSSVIVGIGDDAAVLSPTFGLELVVSTDSLVVGRHFTADWDARDIGHLALAVNLSDLAAMGARPRWVLLALTLPEADPAWLDRFLDGFLDLARETGIVLVGGNISSGPMNIGVQVIGDVNPTAVATRAGARPGDILCVTGTLGDAAAALQLGAGSSEYLQRRLRRPACRIGAGGLLAEFAHAMIDVSDGLLADLSHLLEAGDLRLGARIDLARLPASEALASAFPRPELRWPIQLGGGNDYELLVAVPPDQLSLLMERANSDGLALSRIGSVTDDGVVRCLDASGQAVEFQQQGWDHFV